MEKIEMRARARAAARAAGMFDVEQRLRAETRETRTRSSPDRRRRAPAPALTAVNEAQARAACAPMGELETIVQAADATGRRRAMYVVVPDPAMKPHYERLGLSLEPGCRVLLDAAALLPVAVLRLSRLEPDAGSACPSGTGFNPYYDLPAA
jgi:hypothetical protein